MGTMITLCIPTKNRPGFVARLLQYYAQTGYRHQVLIGDSSDLTHAEATRRIAESFQDGLQVQYASQPGWNVIQCLEALSRRATTPYCTWVSDDDFLCTRGLDRCVAFLEDHPDYAAAHGLAMLFQVEGAGSFGAIGSARRYPHATLEGETATQRLQDHFANLRSLHTALRRTPHFLELVGGYGQMAGARQGFIFDDLIPHGVAAIQGKVKTLDCLYLVRNAHAGMYRQMNLYEWVTDPDWWPSYQVFRDRVVDGLMRQDGLTHEEASRVVTEAFWPYLAQGLTRSWQRYRTRPEAAPQAAIRFRALAAQMPGVRQAWRRLRAAVQRWRDELSLPALLHPSSPYHDDFMQIYHAVQTPPAPLWQDAAFAGVRCASASHDLVGPRTLS